MNVCLACGTPIEAFMSFGRQPISNCYVPAEGMEDEYFFEMSVAVCPDCSLFQLMTPPDPGIIYHENYAFFSQTSKRMQQHFEGFAQDVMGRLRKIKDPFVVEIGSNDGILLRNFSQADLRHLGIEPSQNVAEIATDAGVETVCLFFGDETVDDLIEEYGKADVILSANAISHIPDLTGLARSLRKMLNPKGLLIFEDPYLGSVLENTSYDQIYNEHVFIFSVTSVRNVFLRHDLELLDVQPQWVHGGSMRYVLGIQGMHRVSKTVTDQLALENERGLDRLETYERFRVSCETRRTELVDLLKKLKSEGKSVVGYAATAKSSTILNYCGIGPHLVDYICDTTPVKQGKFSPGMHIPIKPHQAFLDAYPDCAILFAWNHRDEILEKEQAFKEQGGKWVSFSPEVRIE